MHHAPAYILTALVALVPAISAAQQAPREPVRSITRLTGDLWKLPTAAAEL